MFAEWEYDDEKVLDQCFKNDIQYWKLAEFIRDKADLRESTQVFQKYFRPLKKIHLVYAARSVFPCINWRRYQDLCEECEIMDSNVTLDTLDKAFIDTNMEIEAMPDNPATALQRFEFLEIIARIAEAKYIKTGRLKKYHKAIERLIDDHLLRVENKGQWQEFRDHELWTVEIDRLYEANAGALRAIYESCKAEKHGEKNNASEDEWSDGEAGSRGRDHMTMADAIKLLVGGSGVGLS